jgi:betaine-aldehyde dehydrogenase
VGTTLAQIAGRAGVSPGLVAHYFGDKDGLLDAAFRSLARRVGDQVRARLRSIAHRARESRPSSMPISRRRNSTGAPAPRGSPSGARCCRCRACGGCSRCTSGARSPTSRVRSRSWSPPDEAQSLAAMIAAMIDGVWLRAALSGWREADSASARALLTEFVDRRLNARPRARRSAERGTGRDAAPGEPAGPQRFRFHQSRHRRGAGLCERRRPGGGRRGRARRRSAVRPLGGDDRRGARAGPAASRADPAIAQPELAELETRDTGKPIQETSSSTSFPARIASSISRRSRNP